MLTTILELTGLALLVAAAYIGLGLPVALALAGAALIAIAWNLERRPPERRPPEGEAT